MSVRLYMKFIGFSCLLKYPDMIKFVLGLFSRNSFVQSSSNNLCFFRNFAPLGIYILRMNSSKRGSKTYTRSYSQTSLS